MFPIFFGKVEHNSLQLDNPDEFRRYLLSLQDKQVEVIVRLPRKDRTTQQNKYYWSCVVGIPAEHFGYLPEEMHEAYKWMFLRLHEEGKPETVKSTTSLSTIEFNEFVEKCRQWTAEQDLVIPDPEQVELSV